MSFYHLPAIGPAPESWLITTPDGTARFVSQSTYGPVTAVWASGFQITLPNGVTVNGALTGCALRSTASTSMEVDVVNGAALLYRNYGGADTDLSAATALEMIATAAAEPSTLTLVATIPHVDGGYVTVEAGDGEVFTILRRGDRAHVLSVDPAHLTREAVGNALEWAAAQYLL